jgi:hypothetical protein
MSHRQKIFENILKSCDNNIRECLCLLEENELSLDEDLADELWIIFNSKSQS